MGCDIHLYHEIKRAGKWLAGDTWVEEVDGDYIHFDSPYESRLYTDRNYAVFSMLADVRNGYGFAGSDTGDALVPMFEPRGVPDDACRQYRRKCDDYGVDGHSHSWATLQELLDYDWTQVAICRGVVSAEVYKQWDRWGRANGRAPSSYCGALSGPRIQVLPEKELKLYLSGEKPCDDLAKLHTQVQWEERYYQLAAGFLSEVLPKLLMVAKANNLSYDEVRIVYFFDN